MIVGIDIVVFCVICHLGMLDVRGVEAEVDHRE